MNACDFSAIRKTCMIKKISVSEAYSVRMRASSGGNHVSGAEKIVSASSVSKVATLLVERALSHERGTPDFINVKVEALPEGILRLKALPVKTHVVATPAEGRGRNGRAADSSA